MTQPTYTATDLPEGAMVWGRWRSEGPVHVTTKGPWGQAWCGARPQMPHTMKSAGTPVTCQTCLRRLRVGRAQARR